ncbi:MAG TPA: YbhB/YbcL family Raf kinase inhibitor-like protein [Gallionella sp.]|nr:YbhB/YbcL family Raf kinase inhibitor-like protein [Gallionella sp.]
MDTLSLNARRIWFAVPVTVLLSATVAAADSDLPRGGKENSTMSMMITSPSFKHNGTIPSIHTCDGPNISPQLEWTGLPAGTKSLALVVDDPDAPDPAAPKMTWVHWVLYNIPADSAGLPEGATAEMLPSGTLQGLNDWRRTGYGGPCPPKGKHRYFFKLYALDVALPDLKQPGKSNLEKAMQGHVLARSELVGLYQRH